MKNVFFRPFVGDNYDKGYNGVKLLVLGESQYCEEECDYCGKINEENSKCTESTIKNVAEYLRFKKGEIESDTWMSTYTRFTNVFLNGKIDNSTLIDFWNSIMFYNYVQSTAPGPRTSPTKQQFVNSEAPFFEVLAEYEPDLVLAWGDRLWEKLPETGRVGTETIIDNKNGQFYYYTVGNKEIPVYGMYHPSSSAFNNTYTPYMEKAFKIVKENLNTK